METNSNAPSFRPVLAAITGLAAAILLCLWLYVPGLDGPLVLDDQPNLEDVTRYLDGKKTAWAVITDNRSGPTGRPLSMASFVADVSLWGNSTWYAKRTNLILHLLTAVAIFVLIQLVLIQSRCSRPTALMGALLVAAIWLLHPINVSSVLYLIQRMAQLSALFLVLGLLVYVLARLRIDRQQIGGQVLLWFGVPLMTLCAVLSKENGILLPFLAYGLECTVFRQRQAVRHRSVTLFFIVALFIPLLFGMLWMLSSPDRFLGGYVLRDFTLWERVLTQARVLWSYAFALVVPQVDVYGVFQDDYRISRGLLDPWNTWIAMLAWTAVLASAWALRQRIPLFSAGVWLFLGGHLVESSILPLEIYFEHRNYFSAIGLWMALFGLGLAAYRAVSLTRTFRMLGIVLLIAYLCILSLFTANQVHTWTSSDSFYFESLRHKPDSFRLHSYLLGRALVAGRFDGAIYHIDEADRLLQSRALPVIPLWRMLAYCSVDESVPTAVYSELEARMVNGLTNRDMIAWEMVAQRYEAGDCPGLDAPRVASIVEAWLDLKHLPAEYIQSWKSRYLLGRFLAASGRLEEGLTQVEQSWAESGENRGIGILVFQLNASLGRLDRCEQVLQRLEAATGGGDLAFDEAVATLRTALDSGELASPADQD